MFTRMFKLNIKFMLKMKEENLIYSKIFLQENIPLLCILFSQQNIYK